MRPVRISIAEYVAMEEASRTKSELVNGRVIAMSGASYRHNAIAMNVAVSLANQLRGTPCRPVGSEQRVHVLSTDLDTYPDLTVVCGDPEVSPVDRHAVTNPTLLVEVLSPSTESYDRGAKWVHYQQIRSLREYLLVSSGEPRLERFFRGDDDGWRYELVGDPGGAMRLSSCAVTLALADVYADVPAE